MVSDTSRSRQTSVRPFFLSMMVLGETLFARLATNSLLVYRLGWPLFNGAFITLKRRGRAGFDSPAEKNFCHLVFPLCFHTLTRGSTRSGMSGRCWAQPTLATIVFYSPSACMRLKTKAEKTKQNTETLVECKSQGWEMWDCGDMSGSLGKEMSGSWARGRIPN